MLRTKHFVEQQGDSGTNVLSANPDGWSSVPVLKWWRERTDSHKLSSDLHTHAAIQTHIHTQTHILNKQIKVAQMLIK